MSKKLSRERGEKSVTEKDWDSRTRERSKNKGVKAKDQISTTNKRSCNELYYSLLPENCVFSCLFLSHTTISPISMEVSLSFPQKKMFAFSLSDSDFLALQ